MPISLRRNATGSETRWVRRSGHGRLSLYEIRPSEVQVSRSWANAGRAPYLGECLQLTLSILEIKTSGLLIEDSIDDPRDEDVER